MNHAPKQRSKDRTLNAGATGEGHGDCAPRLECRAFSAAPGEPECELTCEFWL